MANDKYLIISYCTCIFALVAFAVYAVIMYTQYLRRRRAKAESTDEFFTARRTMTRWRIAWSFFASAVGSWCITAPASFAVWTGWVGLLMYSIAAGLPVFIIAVWGDRIQAKYPDVATLSDYVGRRFGPVARTFVVAIGLFNMAVAMLAEYTTIGLLFKYFVGSTDYPIVIVVGIITMLYTAYGGVYISIITDQAQGILTILLLTILVIYVAVTFRPDLPTLPDGDYGEFPLNANPYGYSAIFSMPCSLLASTVFSEAMWQKVWASEDRGTVIFGGAVGSVMITIAVFLFGFGGWLAAWAGYVTFATDPNLYLFQVFADQRPEGDVTGASTQVASWVGVVTLILACTMNESAIDSMQNGLAAVLANQYFPGQHSFFGRLLVVLINIPIIVVSLQGYPVLSLFLMTNILTTCFFLLLALGLWDYVHEWVTETGILFGFSVAMLTVTAFGIGRNWEGSGHSIPYGAWYTWWGNITYEWRYFAVASGFSVVGLLMWDAGKAILLYGLGIEGPGITRVLARVPGFGFVTGSGFAVDLMTLSFFRPLARLLRYEPAAASARFDSIKMRLRSIASGTYGREPVDGAELAEGPSQDLKDLKHSPSETSSSSPQAVDTTRA